MANFESTIHWRQYSSGIILAIFIAVFALGQFHLLQVTFSILLGCSVLATSLVWNIYVMKRAHSMKGLILHPQIADGLLLAGLILVFIGGFF